MAESLCGSCRRATRLPHRGYRVTVDVVGGDEVLERDGDRLVEAAGLAGTDRVRLRGEGRLGHDRWFRA
jgi:hypothetical protein